MKFLIAPNSFKEVADSVLASGLFLKYLDDKRIDFFEKPVSDGGDAFLKICEENYKLDILTYDITGSYSDELMSIPAGYDKSKYNLYIESAEILGLKVIPQVNRKPGEINSKGLGDLLKIIKEEAANNKLNVQRIYIGIGGTGTNDLALGACSRFGLRLFDDEKELEVKPVNYYKVKRIEWKGEKLPFKLIPILDVNNKLLGENGATLTFGKQKGADEKELKLIEKGFDNIINILINMGYVSSADNLSGAGGGLAAGLSIFFNAETRPAKEFILKDLGLNKMKNKVDYVVTGEGYFDAQSLMEKGAGIIIDEYKDSVKRVFLVCGEIEKEVKEKLNENVYTIELRKYFSSKEESIKNFEKGIELACKEIRKVLNSDLL